MRWVSNVVLVVAAVAPFAARAAPHSERPPQLEGVDTSYGRIDGDFVLALSSGVAVGSRGPRGAIDARARFLDVAGLFVTYEDAFGGPSEPRRVLSVGADLRLVYLARWVQGWHWAKPYADLHVDSFSIELGAAWMQPQAVPNWSRTQLHFALALELPLLPHATGPWIGVRGGARWSDDALATTRTDSALDRSGFVMFTLGWHQVVNTGLVGGYSRKR